MGCRQGRCECCLQILVMHLSMHPILPLLPVSACSFCCISQLAELLWSWVLLRIRTIALRSVTLAPHWVCHVTSGSAPPIRAPRKPSTFWLTMKVDFYSLGINFCFCQFLMLTNIIILLSADGIPTVFIAVAGRSNGLGPVLSGNATWPVINCPPIKADWGSEDVWSSLRLPSGQCFRIGLYLI